MAEKCPFCGYQNESDVEYCHFCNATLGKQKKPAREMKSQPQREEHEARPPRSCNYCGTPVPHGSEACPNCGRPTGSRDYKETASEVRATDQGPPQMAGRYCESCRIWWPEKAIYCQKCGSVIDPELKRRVDPAETQAINICPNCGTRNARKEKYCCTCAAILDGSKK